MNQKIIYENKEGFTAQDLYDFLCSVENRSDIKISANGGLCTEIELDGQWLELWKQ